MKEKKNSKAKKVLLMIIASVLVAAISVSGTLAYLTAQSEEKDNVFKSSPGIKGEIQEPNFDATKKFVFQPGKLNSKDPIVQNRTAAPIIVGLRLDYYINVLDGTDANYVEVPYSTFSRYVDLIYNSAPASNTTPSVGFNTGDSGDWTDFTSNDSFNTTTDTAGKFFYYKTILTKDNADDIDQGSGATAAAKLGDTNYVDATAGNGDNTKPIFNQVRVKTEVNIGKKSDGTYTMLTYNDTDGYNYYVNTSDSVYTAAYNASIANAADPSDPTDAEKAAATNAAKAAYLRKALASAPLATSYFKVFNFKIKITGVGVVNDGDLQSQASGTTDEAYIAAAQPYLIADLKSGATAL